MATTLYPKIYSFTGNIKRKDYLIWNQFPSGTTMENEIRNLIHEYNDKFS